MTRSFAMGVKARDDGLGMIANPFLVWSDDWINWRHGWLECYANDHGLCDVAAKLDWSGYDNL